MKQWTVACLRRLVRNAAGCAILLLAAGVAQAQISDLSITKTDGSATEVPGTSVTYTIVASNAGPNPVVAATVSDTFDPVLGGISWTCVAAGGATCTAAGAGDISDSVDLPLGGSVTYTVSATISSTATGSLTNTAAVAVPGGVIDPNLLNNSATDTDSLTPQVNLAITKTDGAASDIPGTTITYTIVASNPVGPSAVTGATVADTFPGTLTGVSWTCSASPGSSCPGAGAGNISAPVSLLVGGTATFTVNATISAGATGTLNNTATITAPGGTTETAPANNTATDSDTLTPRADMTVSKTDSADPSVAGTNLTYTVTVTNNGPSNATGVTLVDTLPPETTFVSSTPGGPTCTHALGVVTCSLGSLAASASTVVTITALVASSVVDGATISNTAVVSAATTDPGPSANIASESTTIEREPDLGVSKTSPSPVIAGTSFAYTVVVENNGPSDASLVVLTDTLPNETSFVSAPGCSHDGSPTGGVVTCNIGDLVAGATQSFTITAFVDPCTLPGTLIDNQADVAHNFAETDPGPTPNTFLLSTLVDTRADLSITKTDTPDPTLAGEEVTYTVTITNSGPSCARNVVATDTMAPNVLFRDGKSDPTCIGAAIVTCSEGTMTPGQTITLIITGKVECSALDGSVQTNSITVTSTDVDPDNSDNTASTSTTVDTLSDISVVKSDAPDPVQPASLLTYNFDVSNAGPSDANSVVLVDTLPAGVSYVSGSEGCSAAGNVVTCQVGVVACGKVERPRIRVRVETTDSPLVNSATVSTATVETTTGNNGASASTTVRSSPRFLLRMSGAPRFLREGGVTTALYMLRAQNKTLLPISGASLIDVLPTGVTFVESVPPPSSVAGQSLTWNLGTLVPGGTQIVLIRAALVAGTPAGTSLVNSASLIEDGNTVATASFTGGVREPQTAADGKLTATLTTVRRVLAGSSLTATIDINNTGNREAQNVVVQLTIPAGLAVESALPAPSSSQIDGDVLRLTWNVDSLRGPGKKRIKVTQQVPANLAGSSLALTATVVDNAGRSGGDAAVVEVRD